MNKRRFFIVPPTEAGKDLGDKLHRVCSTASCRSYLDIYQNDLYVEEAAYATLKGAADYCWKRTGRRPWVLG